MTPLFKKNDELKKRNYEPSTVLPVLNRYKGFYRYETALLKFTEDWRAMLDKRGLFKLQ